MKAIPCYSESDLVILCEEQRSTAGALLRSTRRTYGLASDALSRIVLPAADRLAKRWLTRTQNPYLDEIDGFAKIIGEPGVHALNLSYEWGCTSGVIETEHGPDMMRILDWPFPGLGEALIIVQQSAEAGPFYNITWPAVSGIFQAMAPGRFAAAINQAPMRQHGLSHFGDWIKNRRLFYRENGLPPAHLLRQVFETARDFTEAKNRLAETSICIPVIFTLSGTKPGEACVIERLETTARIRTLGEGLAPSKEELSDTRVCVSNHFQTDLAVFGKGWLPRAVDSAGRAEQIVAMPYPSAPLESFESLPYPMVNPLTRLCMIANADTGSLMVQGWERTGPVTEIFRV